jgi:hypothetical protein
VSERAASLAQGGIVMNTVMQELHAKTDAAWSNVNRQLQGMESHLEQADAPGEWTTREVLSHLLFQEGSNMVDLLKTFARRDYPLFELGPGDPSMTPARRTMSLRQLIDALDAQRKGVFGYLDGLPEADLAERKLRIPLFKEFMETDEISLAMFTGAMYDFHWNDHAGQLAKIRKAVGLPAAH